MKNLFTDFDSIWNMELPAVEEPNKRRGGWSGVYIYDHVDTDGKTERFFVKRQENHYKKTLLNPLKGRLTFDLEYINIQKFQARQVPVVEAIFFEKRKFNGKDQAILITKNLEGYTPLDDLLRTSPVSEHESLLKKSGELIRQMHDANLVHRCLHPKHLFLKKTSNTYEGAFIDLEKVREASFNKNSKRDDLRRLLKLKGLDRQSLITPLVKGYLHENEKSESLENYLSHNP
ncbi:lipopolysaccharide kinase InaA family protein [Lentisphaera profundi]|uniref:Lipopolysaccharide kinase InaA family protein n=1 Tax=Lentisphaera profundi TaxID=1658616 RepID=A0ABY7VS74_9BACT|nr:lipopolysaccharide kinase InaA family protein [Lentisphaera profundi]WDE96589.1 lipopolysaccharide kinase InaA family protein [Lentisphaera profundi]